MTRYDLIPVACFIIGFLNALCLFRYRTLLTIAEKQCAVAQRDLARAQRDQAEQDRDQAIRQQLLAFNSRTLQPLPTATVDDAKAKHPAGKALRVVPGQRG